MFATRNNKSAFQSAVSILEVTYHATVRGVQGKHSNALIALFTSVLNTLVLVAVFYLMFAVLGLRSAAVRGDFILYLLSGIMLYMTHIRTVGVVMGAQPAASGMMQHAPMNTAIALLAAGFGVLYIQILSISIVLLIYHCAVTPIEIDDPFGAFFCFFMSWAFGFVVGVLFYALKPWAPGIIPIISQFYQRANMIASGKMFLANSLPGYMLAMFDWNPLFHLIDQARGFTFINYNPHFSNLSYPVYVALGLLVIALMMEFYTRRMSSASWSAR